MWACVSLLRLPPSSRSPTAPWATTLTPLPSLNPPEASPRVMPSQKRHSAACWESAEAHGGAKLSEQVVKNVGINFFFSLSFELYQSENLQAIIQIKCIYLMGNDALWISKKSNKQWRIKALMSIFPPPSFSTKSLHYIEHILYCTARQLAIV